MKAFLIGLAIYFVLAWLPQLMRAWWLQLKYHVKRKRATDEERWMYEV